MATRLRSLDLRPSVALLGMLVQGAAWFLVFITLLLAISAMPGFFQKIPPGIQIACELLVVLAAALLARMLLERRRVLRAFDEFLSALAPFPAAGLAGRNDGLAHQRLDAIRASAERLTGKPRAWWSALDEALEFYEGTGGEGGWFLTQPATEILTEDDLVTPFYHSSFHQAVPGILTALGLLATFTAILVALAGVSYNARNPSQPVTGIDALINGLAGKFLSSILALILSMVFTFVEKKYCERQIDRRREELLGRVKEIFPFLSQARILLDLQRIATAFQNRLAPEADAGRPEIEGRLTRHPGEIDDSGEDDPHAAQFGR
ncbi:MAG TPA: hypothetical protein VG675_04695 [Bryobacteraceae bacterium]|nr:hypothetical protein [Bryobacteraceae bacterium]